MSDNPSGGRQYVVHVHGGKNLAVSAAEASLAAISLRVEECPDVYRGLARLARSDGDRPAAVIVCVDGLGDRELGFFPIVARQWSDVRVYVYSSPDFEVTARKAIGRGGCEVLGDEAICSLTVSPETSEMRSEEEFLLEEQLADQDEEPAEASLEEATASGYLGEGEEVFQADDEDALDLEEGRAIDMERFGFPEPASFPEDDTTEEERTAGDRVGPAGDEEEAVGLADGRSGSPAWTDEGPHRLPPVPATEEIEEVYEEGEDGKEPAHARVPWLRYSDGPVRRPPGSDEGKPAAPSTPESDDSCDVSSDAPLLCDEELEALIGDGINLFGEEEEEEDDQ